MKYIRRGCVIAGDFFTVLFYVLLDQFSIFQPKLEYL